MNGAIRYYLPAVAAFAVGGWIGLLALRDHPGASGVVTSDHANPSRFIPKRESIQEDVATPRTASQHQSAALNALADPLTSTSALLRRCDDPFAAAVIFPFLADTEPGAVLAFLKTLDPDRARSFADATASMFERWAVRDSDAAISAVSTLPSGFRSFVATGVLDGIFRAESDSDACLDAALILIKALPAPDGFPPPEWIQWLAVNPDNAIETLDALPKSGLRTMLLESFAATCPADAFAWTMTVANPIQRNSLARRTILALAESDPGSAIELWAALPDQLAKDSMTASLAKRFASHDPEQAMSWVENRSFSSDWRRRWAEQEVYAKWIANDFKAATTHALSQESTRERLTHVRALAEAVFGKSSDPAQARQLLELVGDDRQVLRAILENSTDTWLTRNLTGAIDYAGTMKPNILPPSFLSQIADAWSREDPKAFALWASSASVFEIDPQLPSPGGAAEFLQNQTGHALSFALANAVRWKPAEAIATITQHPELVSAAGYNTVATNYFRSDFDGAAAWLQSFAASGADRDKVVSALNGLGAVLLELTPEQQATARATHAQLSAE